MNGRLTCFVPINLPLGAICSSVLPQLLRQHRIASSGLSTWLCKWCWNMICRMQWWTVGTWSGSDSDGTCFPWSCFLIAANKHKLYLVGTCTSKCCSCILTGRKPTKLKGFVHLPGITIDPMSFLQGYGKSISITLLSTKYHLDHWWHISVRVMEPMGTITIQGFPVSDTWGVFPQSTKHHVCPPCL